MITRNIAYTIVAAATIICLQNIDAAQRRAKTKKEPKGGNMSLAELREQKTYLTSVIDWKTGKRYNETVFSSDSLPHFSSEERPVQEPSFVISRGQLQAIVAKGNACAPALTGTGYAFATGNPVPLFAGLAASLLCMLPTVALNDNSDVAQEEIATRDDYSMIIDAIEHDRWAKQHPRLAIARTRGGPHLKTE